MVKFFKSNIFFFLLLTVVVFSLYGKSINFDFTYFDDDWLVLDRLEFLSDINNIPKLFETSVYFSKDFQYYRPILNLSFLLETSLFGFTTKIYHLTNTILFVLSLYLMYVFLKNLKLNETILKFILILVSVHPILTSCVVWIPARNDTLLCIFVYLLLIFFIKYLENNSLKNLFLYVLFWTLALFTKETSIIILLLLPLFVWCFDYSLNKREIVKNLCLIIPILLIYFYLRNIAVSENNLLIYITNINIYLKNIFFGLSLYFYQLIFLDIYIISHQDQFNFLYFLVAFSTALFIIIYLYKNFSNKKYFIWCILFLILFLFPTFLLEDYSVLNHRIIIPISAIVMIATMFIEQIINIKYIKHILIFLFCFLFIYCFYYSSLLQYKYKNEINFKVNAYIDAPNYHPTCYWMARLYIQQEEFEKAKDFLQKANFYGNNRYLSDLALIYYCEGNMDKAEELYNKSIEYGINKAQCYRNLSVIYLKRDNDIDKAIEYAKLAVQKEPYDDGYKQYLQRLIDEKNNF